MYIRTLPLNQVHGIKGTATLRHDRYITVATNRQTLQEKDVKVSYGVFPTQYADKYAYFIASTSEIQNENSTKGC